MSRYILSCFNLKLKIKARKRWDLIRYYDLTKGLQSLSWKKKNKTKQQKTRD